MCVCFSQRDFVHMWVSLWTNVFSLLLNKTSICVILSHCLVAVFRGLLHTDGSAFRARFMPFFMIHLSPFVLSQNSIRTFSAALYQNVLVSNVKGFFFFLSMWENELLQHTGEGQQQTHGFIWNPNCTLFPWASRRWKTTPVVLLRGHKGALRSLFHLAPLIVKQITSSVLRHMIGSKLRIQDRSPPQHSPPPSRSLFRRLVNVAQRRSIPADLIKRVAYEATTGLHTHCYTGNYQHPARSHRPHPHIHTHTHAHARTHTPS